MKKKLPIVASLLCMAGFPLLTVAQEAAGEENSVFDLSPFEVNTTGDRGYIAANQVSGTRLNVPIKELPFFLSVVTQEFLTDTGVASIYDTIRFVAGVQPRPVANFLDSGLFIRGQQSDFTFRDGLRSFRPPSTDNIERVEILKGPAAVLFGESAPGGGVNYITKKARFADTAQLTLKTGSYGLFKGVVDVGSVVRDDVLAIRFVGSYETGDAFTDFQENTNWMIAPSLVVRPFEKTRIELNYEHYSIDRDRHLWNGLFAWRGADNIGSPAPDGTANAIDGIHPSADLEDNIFPNGFYTDEIQTFIVNWEQEITDWLMNRFVFAYTDGDNRSAGAVVNDRPLVNETVFDPDTLNMVVARLNGNRNTEHVLRNELLATYEGMGGRHSLLLGFEDVKDLFTRFQMPDKSKYRDNNNYGIAWNAVTKEYFGLAIPGAINLRNDALVPDTKQRADRTGYYANLQSRFMDERLVVLAGIRRHEYERYNRLSGSADGKSTEETPQVGASFAVTPDITVFGSYSESFRPQLGNDALGRPFDNLVGDGVDFGVKVELMDGKLVGTASWFDLTYSGLIRNNPTFIKEDGTPGGNFSSGEEGSSGLDIDLVFSPIPNWQTVIGLMLLDTEVLSNSQQPQLKGQRTINAAELYASLWSKYTFAEGDLEGLWIAGGFSYTGGDRIPRYNWAFVNSSYTLVDLAAGYRFKLGDVPVEVQVNVKNVTDKRYFISETFPGSPREWSLALRMEF